MILKAFCWFDKVDKTYMSDSIMFARSERSVCRGYINAFEQDKKLNPAEYELIRFGTFDDETGEFFPELPPVSVDVKQVYAEQPDTKGDVKDE